MNDCATNKDNDTSSAALHAVFNTLSKKAQTSFEFLVLLGFMLLIFSSFFIFAQDLLQSNNEANIKRGLIDVANQIEQEVLQANQVHEGYARTFTLPKTVEGQAYSAHILGDELTVITDDAITFEYLIFLPFVVYDVAHSESLIVLETTNVVNSSNGVHVIPQP